MGIFTLQGGLPVANAFFAILILATIFFAVVGFCVTVFYVSKAVSKFFSDVEEWFNRHKKSS